MFKRTKVSVAAVLALGLAAAGAQAQDTQRVEITGSSIKRIAAEGALPVQIINAEQIQRSGATSVADLIQKLPAMQGFQVADIAVGSNSGGIATANIHDLGSEYTLVLLNGRRIAPTGSGSTINLQAIPMSAIERIEVLTDGASALYGSDAIAGVVNFVLKRYQKGGELTIKAEKPLEGGGEGGYASLTYGFGDLDKDRFSLVASFRHDQQAQVKATERDFGKTAYLPFSFNGKDYIYDRTSVFAIPANAVVTFKAGSGVPSYSFNPYRKANGKCGPENFYSLNNAATATSVTENCAFNFVSTIETYPENERNALFLSGVAKVSDNLRIFSDIAYSQFDLTARIAPNPVPVSIAIGSAAYNKHVLPNLTATQIANINTVSANYRALDFGTRDSRTITNSKHIVVGAEGEFGKWNYNAALTWSENVIDERYTGGYFKDKEFRALAAAGTVDPFVLAGAQPPATQKLIADSIFYGKVRDESTSLKGVDVRASGDLMKLPAGTMSLGLGADYREYEFKRMPSAAAKAGEIYNYTPVPVYDMSRNNSGVFAELLVPVVKGLELTGAVRYDTISAINNSGKTVGTSMDASTYKLAARFQASPSLLFRASVGTGFKAPSMLEIANPVSPNGVTAASYDCPFPGTPECKPGKLQYTQLLGGNANLKPEQSDQLTVGMRFEPNNDFGIGADYWEVKMKDAVSAVSANQAFANPGLYPTLFSKYRQPAETQEYWAFLSSSTNIGKTVNRGIDWDITSRFKTPVGRLTTGLAGTYMIEAKYTLPGTADQYTTNMGKYGVNAAVTFRNILRATAAMDMGRFSHVLTVNYRSGYTDVNQLVRDVATNTNVRVSLNVPEYSTVDWQTTYNHTKAISLRLGVKNLLNKSPPFTLRDSSGHQVGYDPRYADLMLRTVYLQGSVKF